MEIMPEFFFNSFLRLVVCVYVLNIISIYSQLLIVFLKDFELFASFELWRVALLQSDDLGWLPYCKAGPQRKAGMLRYQSDDLSWLPYCKAGPQRKDGLRIRLVISLG